MVEGTAFRGLRYCGPLRGMCTFATYRWSAPALAPIFDAVLEPGGVLADVGAFMGLYAMWGARRVGPRGKVYAFEPIETSIAQLETHIQINGFDNIEIVNAAVGAEPGEIELQLAEGPFALGISSRYLVQARPEATVKIKQITLDEFFRDRETPDLVKVDVEGMEPEVFGGAQQLMESNAAPVVVFEALADHLEAAGVPYPEVLRFFDQRGYGVWAPQRRGIRPRAAGCAHPGLHERAGGAPGPRAAPPGAGTAGAGALRPQPERVGRRPRVRPRRPAQWPRPGFEAARWPPRAAGSARRRSRACAPREPRR